MASNFPNKVDNIPSFLDITRDDATLINQFENYIKNGDFDNANKILEQIPNVNQKIVTASRINSLRDAIIAMEEFYGVDIEPYIESKQREWQSIIDQFKYVGEYSSVQSYKINNIVSYRIDGADQLFLRINTDTSPNKPPLEVQYWRPLAIKGDRGETLNENTTFNFDWISSVNYTKNSIVSHNNQWWVALKDNIDSEPDAGNENWELIMSAMQPTYPVQPTQPSSQNIGDLWFEVFY